MPSPSVGTRAPRPDPLLEDEPGLALVPPRDRDAVCHALERWVADADSRHRAATAAATFGRGFSWKEITHQHLELYAGLGLPPQTQDDGGLAVGAGRGW